MGTACCGEKADTPRRREARGQEGRTGTTGGNKKITKYEQSQTGNGANNEDDQPPVHHASAAVAGGPSTDPSTPQQQGSLSSSSLPPRAGGQHQHNRSTGGGGGGGVGESSTGAFTPVNATATNAPSAFSGAAGAAQSGVGLSVGRDGDSFQSVHPETAGGGPSGALHPSGARAGTTSAATAPKAGGFNAAAERYLSSKNGGEIDAEEEKGGAAGSREATAAAAGGQLPYKAKGRSTIVEQSGGGANIYDDPTSPNEDVGGSAFPAPLNLFPGDGEGGTGAPAALPPPTTGGWGFTPLPKASTSSHPPTLDPTATTAANAAAHPPAISTALPAPANGAYAAELVARMGGGFGDDDDDDAPSPNTDRRAAYDIDLFNEGFDDAIDGGGNRGNGSAKPQGGGADLQESATIAAPATTHEQQMQPQQSQQQPSSAAALYLFGGMGMGADDDDDEDDSDDERDAQLRRKRLGIADPSGEGDDESPPSAAAAAAKGVASEEATKTKAEPAGGAAAAAPTTTAAGAGGGNNNDNIGTDDEDYERADIGTGPAGDSTHGGDAGGEHTDGGNASAVGAGTAGGGGIALIVVPPSRHVGSEGEGAEEAQPLSQHNSGGVAADAAADSSAVGLPPPSAPLVNSGAMPLSMAPGGGSIGPITLGGAIKPLPEDNAAPLPSDENAPPSSGQQQQNLYQNRNPYADATAYGDEGEAAAADLAAMAMLPPMATNSGEGEEDGFDAQPIASAAAAAGEQSTPNDMLADGGGGDAEPQQQRHAAMILSSDGAPSNASDGAIGAAYHLHHHQEEQPQHDAIPTTLPLPSAANLTANAAAPLTSTANGGAANNNSTGPNSNKKVRLADLDSGGLEAPLRLQPGDEERVVAAEWFRAHGVDAPRVWWSQTKETVTIEIEPANDNAGWSFDDDDTCVGAQSSSLATRRVIEYNCDFSEFCKVRAVLPLFEPVLSASFALRTVGAEKGVENAVTQLIVTLRKAPSAAGGDGKGDKDSDEDSDDDDNGGEGGDENNNNNNNNIEAQLRRHPPRFWTQLLGCSRRTYLGLTWVRSADAERAAADGTAPPAYAYQGLDRPGAEMEYATTSGGGGGYGGGGDFSDDD